MALTVKQLNADASFLLTFEPKIPYPVSGVNPRPFRILMDPWIVGPSTIFHAMFSTATHREPACICSLQELPAPDLVIVSQHKSDHCNEATLRQLPASGTKTLILAEPAAAKVIRSWKYFDQNKVRTIPRWENPRISGKQTVIRVSVPPIIPYGEPGEVTVAFVPQKWDIKGLHAAIGITYRPPPFRLPLPRLLTPPDSPAPFTSSPSRRTATPSPGSDDRNTLQGALPTPPASPSLRAMRPNNPMTTSAPQCQDRPISVIFSPHGISYRSLEQYATTHLAAEGALPLTALLHCFDAISNPWWFGGNICAGMPAGRETAAALGAKAWVSTHDGDKDVRGLVTRMLRTRKYAREEVVEVVSPRFRSILEEKAFPAGAKGTEVLVLDVGEQVALTNHGVWNVENEKSRSPLGRLEDWQLPSLGEAALVDELV